MPAAALLLPSWSDLLAWAGALFAIFVLTGLGRLLTRGRVHAEAALIAGWGGAVLVLTLWGAATTSTLRIPAVVLAAIGVAAHLAPPSRLGREEWRAAGRVLTLALPLLAVMASARPSLPDTWLNLLPNAAYIYDHGFFPADARPPAHSLFAGAPYNMQLVAFIASLVTAGFPPSAMIDLNLLLQLAAALLLARVAAGEGEAAPPWSAAALGILAATALNPGFVPRYDLSAYSEASMTVTTAFAGWSAASALGQLAAGRDARGDLWLFALALAALVNIKQESILMAAGLLVAAGSLTMIASPKRGKSLGLFVLAVLPAAALYLAWRWYVLSHFELGELKNLPLAKWHVAELPLILSNMLRAAAGKLFFFIVLLAVIAVAVDRLLRRERDFATYAAAMLACTAVIYNAGLVLAYVAHFEGEMATGAHSYFRYNTHLGLLLMVALVALLRRCKWRERVGNWPRFLPAAVVLVVLLAPFPLLRMMRFDLEAPNLRVWALAQEAAARIAPEEKLVLILPGDNGGVAPALEGVLRYAPPRRPQVDLAVVPDAAAALALTPFPHALLSCSDGSLAGVPRGDAALLTRGAASWQPEAVWSYAPVPPRARWSQVLAPATLCLPG